MVSFFMGKNERAIPHLEESFARYDPKVHPALAFSYFFEFGVLGQIHIAQTRYSLGQPDQAQKDVDKAVEIARSSNQPHSLGFALAVRGLILTLRGDIAALPPNADECAKLSIAPQAGATNEIYLGWAIARMGDSDAGGQKIRDSLQTWNNMGSKYFLPCFSALLAETCMISGQPDEAVAVIEDELTRNEGSGQDQWQSLVLSIKGDALLARSPSGEADAERCYLEAIEVARSQSAKSWELRAATRLARLWLSQGKTTEASGPEPLCPS